ncbi:hypothetical protein B0O99DRAFT_688291 [Bisporella sp. PMI_857]|nr:hypothetical protein B0O99DRAFT_688291 [Bisporella sp. PMI_857]
MSPEVLPVHDPVDVQAIGIAFLTAETSTAAPDSSILCCTCSAKSPALVVECEPLDSLHLLTQDLEHLFLKLIDKNSEDSADVSDGPKLNSSVVARASLLEFKEVDEIWDEKAYKYSAVESPKPKVRGRVDKKSKETTHFIDIKSFMLRDALKKVLHEVSGISIMEEKLSTSYSDVRQRLDALFKAKEITYDLLWALFKANTLVYTTCQGTEKPRCIKYESATEETTMAGVEYLHIKGSYLDFDGKIVGKVPIETTILKFHGSKPISSLDAFPLHYHSEKEAITEKLVECGRKFCSLTGIQHRQYNGRALQMKKGEPVRITINGRIMVYPVKFHEDNPNYTRPSIFKRSGDINIWLDLDDVPSTQLDESALKKGVDIYNLTTEEYLVCSLGYCLENKLWFCRRRYFRHLLGWLRFDQLQIASRSKKLIQALATRHSSCKKAHAFDDFVKGKGLVSKSRSHMTRDSISLNIAILVPSLVKTHQTSIRACQRILMWLAIGIPCLLLDDADSFLRRRSDNSQKNALVAVFLRKLEYFSGIMLLTTNRVTEFDDTVQSRIYIGLAHSPLGVDTRLSIWESFLTKPNAEGRVVSFSDTELQDLAQRKLNGREIKNAVHAAHDLAEFDRVDLAMDHLHTVLDIGMIFENDFKGTAATDNENAYF